MKEKKTKERRRKVNLDGEKRERKKADLKKRVKKCCRNVNEKKRVNEKKERRVTCVEIVDKGVKVGV